MPFAFGASFLGGIFAAAEGNEVYNDRPGKLDFDQSCVRRGGTRDLNARDENKTK